MHATPCTQWQHVKPQPAPLLSDDPPFTQSHARNPMHTVATCEAPACAAVVRRPRIYAISCTQFHARSGNRWCPSLRCCCQTTPQSRNPMHAISCTQWQQVEPQPALLLSDDPDTLAVAAVMRRSTHTGAVAELQGSTAAGAKQRRSSGASAMDEDEEEAVPCKQTQAMRKPSDSCVSSFWCASFVLCCCWHETEVQSQQKESRNGRGSSELVFQGRADDGTRMPLLCVAGAAQYIIVNTHQCPVLLTAIPILHDQSRHKGACFVWLGLLM
eukprot:34382-Pelagomonas_calceolata.AAC.3